jgi:hypothetical protein
MENKENEDLAWEVIGGSLLSAPLDDMRYRAALAMAKRKDEDFDNWVKSQFIIKALNFLNEEEKKSGKTLDQMDWRLLKIGFKTYLDNQE